MGHPVNLGAADSGKRGDVFRRESGLNGLEQKLPALHSVALGHPEIAAVPVLLNLGQQFRWKHINGIAVQLHGTPLAKQAPATFEFACAIPPILTLNTCIYTSLLLTYIFIMIYIDDERFRGSKKPSKNVRKFEDFSPWRFEKTWIFSNLFLTFPRLGFRHSGRRKKDLEAAVLELNPLPFHQFRQQLAPIRRSRARSG